MQVGKVIATEAKPNTAYSFNFWTPMDSPVGIGTLVHVKANERDIYGVVVEGFGFTDLASALHDFIAAEGDPGAEPATLRPEVRCYSAAVLRVEPEEPLQPVPVGPVYLADDPAVSRALRMDLFQETSGIPVGLYQNGEFLSSVYLDADFLLGPEAAHLNLTGVSGLATKTSAIEFVLSSIFANFKGDVAAVCFNVKGPDLLFLDFPAEAPPDHEYAGLYPEYEIPALTEREREMYQALGVPMRAFENVEYYAPFKSDRMNLNTLRTHPDLTRNVSPLSWGLKEIMKFTEVVLNRDDLDAKADALIQYINQRVVDQTSDIGGTKITVHDFTDLNLWFDTVLKYMEANDRSEWQTHHYATIRKVYNRLSNLVTRYRGLISPDQMVCDLPWGDFKDRSIHVIDVANVEPQGQDLVFTRVVSQLRELLEKKTLGVEHVVVVVDELNKYAPSDGPDTYLKQTLLDISERGRYLGLVLFSAQQFRSQVHKRIVGNSATCIYGRMDMDELATPGYQVLTTATKEKLATLSKGQLMLRHPHFSQPIFVKFPRPNVLRGPDGIKMFPPVPEVPLDEAVFSHLSKLDGKISRVVVRDAISAADGDQDEVVRAMNLTLQKRPDDPATYFRRCIRNKAKLEQTLPDSQSMEMIVSPDPNDPFSY
ncbi:MAG: ATP-binding protein [Armatimonadetes bacterium]|nr:ATP-binding protein [Armatimonadota bacterium]